MLKLRRMKDEERALAPSAPFMEMRAFAREPLMHVEGILNRYGDTLWLPTGPSFKATWMTREPALVEAVLVTQRESFRKGVILQWLKSIFGNSILVSEGEHWRKNRRLMAPVFHRKALQGYADVMIERTDEALDRIVPDQVFSMNEWTMELTLDIVLRCLVGTALGNHTQEIAKALDEGLFYADYVIGRMVPPFDWLPTAPKRALARARSYMYTFIDDIIAQRVASGEEHNDLLGLLLAVRDEDGNGLPYEEVREEVITLLLAGHETTALNIAYWLMILGWRPDITAQLQEELDTVLGDQPATFQDLARLPLLEQAWKESLRMYPPASLISRQATQDTTMGPWKVVEGEQVVIPIWAIHHDPRWYPDPYTFKLERWTAEEEAKRPKFAYLPFGGGNRICIGDQFARIEAKLIVARMLQRFTPFTMNTGDPKFKLTITLRPMEPVQIGLRAR